MKIAIMQPYIFPYIGYFQMVQAVDIFVFYDDVNFIKKGWIHRNNILINHEAYRFTIPCHKISQNKQINEIEHRFDLAEKDKFLKRIEQAYSNAPFFKEFYEQLLDFIKSENSKTISAIAANSVIFIANYLNIKTKFQFSGAQYPETKSLGKMERLKAISKKANARIYINAIGGKDLYSQETFDDTELKLQFIESQPISYLQSSTSFVPWLSIIDVLMFNSIEQTKNLLHQYKLQ